MGTQQEHTMGDNSWAEGDMWKELMPVSVCAGIYDFSGTAANHVYAEEGMNMTPDDVDSLRKAWWNGSSSNWTSDDEFSELAGSGHKAKAAGVMYMLSNRNAFGDADCQHIIQTRKGKSGLVFAHADYTVVVAKFDEEHKVADEANPGEMKPSPLMAGPVSMAVQGSLRSTRSRVIKRAELALGRVFGVGVGVAPAWWVASHGLVERQSILFDLRAVGGAVGDRCDKVWLW